jgi:hypothetical protein
MKKGYIKPEIEVLKIETVELMAASIPGITDDEEATGDDALSKEHDGSVPSFDVWE